MNILITGGAGNVGSGLANSLSSNPNNEITIIDNLLTGELKKIPQKNNVRFIESDVNDYKALYSIMSNYNFDYVFHFAAVVGVQRTLDNPLLVLKDIDGIKNILDISVEKNVKRVFFSSSSEVYGEPVEIPQNEDTTPLNAKLPYAIVKNIGEAYFRSYFQVHGLPYTIFRFFNTYGPNQSTDFVVAKFISLALKNEDICIYGDGSQTRTFCYITDNSETIQHILYDNLMQNETLNIGNDNEITVLELANLVIKLLNSKSKIVHYPALKEGDMMRRKPDINKMKSVLNRPLISLEEGILKTAEAFK